MQTYLKYLRDLTDREVVITGRYPAVKQEKFQELLIRNIHTTMLQASNGGLDETKDFGGDMYKGGITFEKSYVKKYVREILDNCYAYLQDGNGYIYYDIPHLFVASQVMNYKYGRSVDSTKVIAAAMLLNVEDISKKIVTVLKSRGKGLKVGFKFNTYESKKVDYNKKYMMYLTIPEGYNCYLYEPHNIVQIAFLTVMGMDTNNIGNILNSNSNGLLIGSVPQFVETLVYDSIFRNKMYKLDGYFGNNFVSMYNQAIKDKLVGEGYNAPFLYYDRIIPTMCQLMDSAFFKPYLRDIGSNTDLTDEDCFINYITPSCVSVCVRKDLDVRYVLPSVANKLSIVNPEMDFTNILNYL